MNKVFVMGCLTRDPQVKFTTGGSAVCELGMAINQKYKDKQSGEWKDSTVFLDITLWGRTAEVAGEYLQKGKSVLIEGRLQLDTWDDRESGQKRSKLRVVGENMTMLGQGGAGRKKDDAQPPAESGSESSAEPGAEEDVPF